jgi:hypothetical protein
MTDNVTFKTQTKQSTKIQKKNKKNTKTILKQYKPKNRKIQNKYKNNTTKKKNTSLEIQHTTQTKSKKQSKNNHPLFPPTNNTKTHSPLKGKNEEARTFVLFVFVCLFGCVWMVVMVGRFGCLFVGLFVWFVVCLVVCLT